MVKKWIALILVLSCTACIFSGCDAVSDIAGNVLEVAKEELVKQIRSTLEEYKVEVVEVKPVTGKLNDEGGELQFFCATLVKTNAESSAQDCANALGKLFEEAGFAAQTDANVESEHLVHKSVTYSRTDYSEGNYYTVYVYTSDVSKIVDLDALKAKLENK